MRFNNVLDRKESFFDYKTFFKVSKIPFFLRAPSLAIFQNEKTPFQAIKTTSSKTRKIKIFAKGLVTHGFGPKLTIFPSFFFQALQTKKMCCTTFQNDKMPLQAIKKGSSKRGKIAIFAKGLTHGFGPKLAIFPCFFFQALQSRKMCFTIFQNKKTPFQAIKTGSSKVEKIAIFAKGLTRGSGLKLAIFPSFVFRQYRVGKCV